MLQDIPATCDGCGKKFSIEHTLSCPKSGLVLARHDDAEEALVALGARALFPSAITYEPKSTVGQYRERGPGQECSRIVGLPTAARTL